MKFSWKSKEYNEGWKAFDGNVFDLNGEGKECPYPSDTVKSRAWHRGFDAAEMGYAHNAGGDW